MTTLADVSLNHVVQIDEMTLENELKHRLQDLGMVVGSKIAVVNHSGDNGIILLHNTRLALSQSLLKKIFVKELTEDQQTWVSLDQLRVGEQGVIVNVHGSGSIKRRLMDMGLTKGTPIKIVKLAPLGDPIELRVRGYELSLRKSESEMVIVAKEVE
ncbi:FeoA family protein [Enterococcus xiangfangensis]|uniref:Ferrous iron transport protein A n=1 Tax=Enterococcus xiangfangensis TaxID=1296537 RepID=A0ABU3F9W9_9ENTE|nr:ferrous iron transport protein A [Enterococcus xiangfangensis]MBM7710705.1 ferrous iron transport protein A [Enterococcus xiangfangensis]MDT2758465.1 ferrous iron transport protein A [Enterococcus xiangfangensis]NBK09016.1 ferrous iron transport protein A [Enterococcus asini]